MLKKLFYFSVILNIFLISALGFFLYKKGGIQYIQYKLGIIRAECKPKEHDISIKFNSPQYQRIMSMFQIMPRSNNDIVFVGDSRTEACNWGELFQDSTIRNRGIGSDTTGLILQRIDDITKSMPQKIFIMNGVADLNDLCSEVSTVLDNYRNIIETIMKESPDTRIYIQSELPKRNYACQYMSLNDDVIKLNDGLKSLASEYGHEYIDLHSLFKTKDNQLKSEYTYDGGHLNAKAYLVWKSAIEKYVKE